MVSTMMSEMSPNAAMSEGSPELPRWYRRCAAALLLLVPLSFAVFYSLLQANFSYPAILDAAPDIVLRRFVAGGPALVATWYGYMAAALLFVPLVALLHQVIAAKSSAKTIPWLPLATVIGVCAGLLQTLGLARWVFLTPTLASIYADPTASAATRESVTVSFQTFNAYLGSGIGEHLGYLLTGGWTLLIGATLVRVRILPRWLAGVGAVLALGILAGDAQLLGIAVAAQINGISYLLWAIWLMALGLFVWRMPQSLVTPTADR